MLHIYDVRFDVIVLGEKFLSKRGLSVSASIAGLSPVPAAVEHAYPAAPALRLVTDAQTR
jgi:hypothetical protein